MPLWCRPDLRNADQVAGPPKEGLMSDIETLERLREICLELPEAFEEFT